MYLFAAGSNARGQLANGTEDDSHSFQRCTFDGLGQHWPRGTKLLFVAAGANHTLVLLETTDGITQLWGCGDNRRGQIGINVQVSGSSLNLLSFSHIQLDHIEGMTEFGLGGRATKIKVIEAAWETSFIVIAYDDEDRIFSAGANDYGDLGIGGAPKNQNGSWHLVRFRQLLPDNATEIRVLALRAGPHTIIAKVKYSIDGSQGHIIIGWGASRHSQLGRLGTTSSQKLPNFITLPAAITFDGDADVKDFAIGNQHLTFCNVDGKVIPYGSNRKGQLGGLESARHVIAVQATWNSTYLTHERPNASESIAWSVSKTALGGSQTPSASMSSPASHSPASSSGELQAVKFPEAVKDAQLLSLVCGSEHVLAHLATGENTTAVFGWGWNEHGNLGLGHTSDITSPTQLWPREAEHTGRITGIWAGCATSWIAIEGE